MYVKQIYTQCLSHAAYYVASGGFAAIFDPLREVSPYLDLANERGDQINYVFETHFHADFVSGHLDLQLKTGAPIIYGPTAQPYFNAITAVDGQIFKLGDSCIKVIHTPGHTLESSCFLLIDELGKEQGLVTGDTLFIGDVGRPDLAQHVNAQLTQEKLAGMLFYSIRDKIMPLSDDLIIYPNHGAGSSCGKKLSHKTVDTLGNQKVSNYALIEDMTKDEFVTELLHGLEAPPAYFPQNVLLNMQGYHHLHKVMERALTPLSAEQFVVTAIKNRALIIDSRSAMNYAGCSVPGSINIGIDGAFATWVGSLVSKVDQPLVLICEPGKEEETVTRLSRVGYDGCIGYLKGGIKSWVDSGKPVRSIKRIGEEEVINYLKKDSVVLLDVRKKSEYKTQCITGAVHIPLTRLKEDMHQLDPSKNYLIYCAGGYRSMIAASILKNHRFTRVVDVIGGLNSLKQNPYLKLSTYQELTSQL